MLDKTGFKVQSGDVIKVNIVDGLSYTEGLNPIPAAVGLELETLKQAGCIMCLPVGIRWLDKGMYYAPL